MPNNPYDKKTLVYVSIGLAGNMIFRTAMDNTLYTDLGVTAVTSASIPGKAFFEANSPSPAVAKRRTLTGNDAFFCDFANADTLKAADWNVAAPEYRGILPASAAAKAVTRVVTTSTVSYAWNEPNYKNTAITASDRTALGIDDATPADLTKLVWGATFPKPAMATKTTVATGTQGPINTSRSFVSDSKVGSLPAGFVLIRSAYTAQLYFGV